MCGSAAAATTVSGELASSNSAVSYEFDGTSWSSAATELQTVSSVAAFGSSSVDGIKVAGYNSNSTIPAMDFVEHFDGVCWSSRNVVLVRRWNHRTSIQGTSSAAIIFGGKQVTDVFGGYSGYGGTTEEYDGVVWLSRGTMNNAVYSTGYAGTSSAALSVGGYDAANNLIAYVEEYTVGSGAYNAIINLH